MSPRTRPRRLTRRPSRLSENGYSEESGENVRESGYRRLGLRNRRAPIEDMDIPDSDCSFNVDLFEVDPREKSSDCGIFGKIVKDNDEGVQCDGPCISWVHRECGGISPARYRRMGKEEEWLCPGHTLYIMR